MTRRELLVSVPIYAAATVMLRRSVAAAVSDLDFASALDAAAAIRAEQVSSFELTRRVFARIDRYNPKLNAFSYQMRDQALAQAREADAALSRGDEVGTFHGVPICVKESFGVKGEPDTWGNVALRSSKAPTNSAVVQRLLGAGAVLVGGTNVPLNLMDWQSFNDIYGTTNNPWDLTRTRRRLIGRERRRSSCWPVLSERGQRYRLISARTGSVLRYLFPQINSRSG